MGIWGIRGLFRDSGPFLGVSSLFRDLWPFGDLQIHSQQGELRGLGSLPPGVPTTCRGEVEQRGVKGAKGQMEQRGEFLSYLSNRPM